MPQKKYTAVEGIFLSTETFYGASRGNNARHNMPPIVLSENCGRPKLPVALSDEEISQKREELVALRQQIEEINKEIQANRREVKPGGMLARSRQQELNKLNNRETTLEVQLPTITDQNTTKAMDKGLAK